MLCMPSRSWWCLFPRVAELMSLRRQMLVLRTLPIFSLVDCRPLWWLPCDHVGSYLVTLWRPKARDAQNEIK